MAGRTRVEISPRGPSRVGPGLPISRRPSARLLRVWRNPAMAVAWGARGSGRHWTALLRDCANRDDVLSPDPRLTSKSGACLPEYGASQAPS